MSSDEARNVTDPTRGRGAGRGESDATDPTRGFSADDPSRLPPDPTAPAGEAPDESSDQDSEPEGEASSA